jgi:Flp pilus assembly protein TadB
MTVAILMVLAVVGALWCALAAVGWMVNRRLRRKSLERIREWLDR